MSQPNPYNREFNFSNYQAANPALPLPAGHLDAEFSRIKAVIDQIRTSIRLMQRDDFAIGNDTVGLDQLKAEVSTGLNPPTTWSTAVNYVVRDSVFNGLLLYACAVSHVSGVFATDLAAGKWTVMADFTAIGSSAGSITYSNATSKLAANDVQAAIDEMVSHHVDKADGRLTLESGVAVSTTDQLAKGTIYYTPYVGNAISLYSGTAWVTRTFSELSLALTATSGKPYDVFVYDNAGTPALETLVWTNDTTRATALVRQNGVWCKTGALTRRYVGTFYASAANQTEDSRKKRYVWNTYNRVTRHCANTLETTDTWDYTFAALRQANANTANEFAFVRGLEEDIVDATIMALASNSNASVFIYVAFGLDSTSVSVSAPEALPGSQRTTTAATYMQMIATYKGYPGVGKHRLVWLEGSNATGTTTWVGDLAGASPVSQFQTGMLGSLRA